MAEYIEKTDTLNEGREKLNEAIDASNAAEYNASKAVGIANNAKTTADTTRIEMQEIIREQTSGGDIIPEVVQARGSNPTLGGRLNTIDLDLAEKAQEIKENKTSLLDVRSKVPDNFGDLILTEHPMVNNPVLTASDVTDMENVRFVADPEIVYHDGMYHMFFEVYVQDGINNVGHIGHAVSPDGRNWTYNKIVLQDGKHFALPTILKLDDGFYMIPDRGGRVEGVTLYKATNFPEEWVVDRVLIPKGVHIDPIPFKWEDKWYMITYTSGVASLYYADDIKDSNWVLHPMSPIATGVNVRGAGRAILSEDCIFVPMQDGTSGVYGEKIKLHKIINLSPTSFEVYVLEDPLLEAGNNKFWNSLGMHSVNFAFANRNSNPIVAVDGLGEDNNWTIGIYTTGARDNRVAFRCRRATPLSIPSGAWTKIIWDSVEYDTQKGYSSASHKYIVPKSGLYEISLQIGMDAGGSSFFGNMRINSNGFEISSKPHNIMGAEREARNLTRKAMLNKGDEITVDAYQNSGTAKDVMSMGSISWLEITKID